MNGDPLQAALFAAAQRTDVAFPLAFAAGLASSIGPCVAPRFVAAAAFGSRHAAPLAPACSFVGGIVAAYLALGAAAWILPAAVAASPAVYGALAVGLAFAAVRELFAEPGCGHAPVVSGGSVFFAGAASALVISPCCTPFIASVVLYGAASRNPLFTSAILTCFALGHAVPVFAAALGAKKFTSLMTRDVRMASTTVTASLMFALSLYYAALA